jgi:uncharacterized protein (DUF169 family)
MSVDQMIFNLSRKTKMVFKKKDFEIFEKLEFDIQPVGIKYHPVMPEWINKLAGKMALCEMLKTAQEGEVFYADAENHSCETGPYVLGHKDAEEQLINGEYGAGLEAYKDTHAAAGVYQHIPKMEKSSVHFITFAPLKKLFFEPDVMIFLGDINQTWILMRALTYDSGEVWRSHFSTVMGCAWFFIYPYLSGEVNFISSGLGFGMKRRKLFPDNRHFVCIPQNRLHTIIRSLNEMPWLPEVFKPGGQEFVKRLREKLALE